MSKPKLKIFNFIASILMFLRAFFSNLFNRQPSSIPKSTINKKLRWVALGLALAFSQNLLIMMLAWLPVVFFPTKVIAASCVPNLLYGAAYIGGVSKLYTIDIATGTATYINDLAFGATGTATLARDSTSTTGRIYSIEFSSTNPGVAYYDPSTNTNTVVGSTGATIPNGAFIFNKLAQQSGTGDLYAMAGASDNLYKIDKTTGVATDLGALTGAFPALTANFKGGDIAFDPNNANRLIVSVGPDFTTVTAGPSGALNNIRFYAVDVTTLNTTFIGETVANAASGAQQSTSLAFGPDGFLYANGGGNFYKIDPTNGSIVNTIASAVDFDDFASLPTTTPTLSLSIAKSSGLSNVNPGSPITYTITLTNSAAGCDVSGITLSDTIPSNATLINWTGTISTAAAGTLAGGGSVSPNNGVTSPISTTVGLNAGSTATFTVNATVNAGATGNIVNTATATVPQGVKIAGTTNNFITATDTVPVNTVTTTVVPQAYKSVKWLRDNDGTGTLTPGDDLQYKISIVNPSATQAISSVVISDVVPTQLQVLIDGSNAIGLPTGFTVASSLPTSSFNGTGSTIKFTEPGTLAAGSTQSLTYNTRILSGASSPITNQALVNYQGDGGTALAATASDSTNSTAAGSGTNAGTPTSVPNGSGGGGDIAQASGSSLPIVKFVSPVTPTGTKSVRLFQDVDGSGNLTTGDVVEYTVTYTNSSAANVTNFLATDTLPSGLSFVAGSYSFAATNGVAATTVTANATYNGTTDKNLTSTTTGQLGNNGGQVTIKFRATVTAAAGTSINNQAVATSSGAVSPSLTDALSAPGDIAQLQDDGINQGNLSGTGDDDPTVMTVGSTGTPDARLRLVKRITSASRSGAVLSGIDFNSFVDDPNDTNDNASGWSQLSPVGVLKLGTTTPLQSGDELEYTVYLLSDGRSQVVNAKFCDLIPSGTTFINDSFGTGKGISFNRAGTITALTNAVDTDAGAFYGTLVPLPTGNVCSSQTNGNGAAIANLGYFPTTLGSNFGYIRFRVKIN